MLISNELIRLLSTLMKPETIEVFSDGDNLDCPVHTASYKFKV